MGNEDYDEERTGVHVWHFDKTGHPVSKPPEANIVWRVSAYACIRDTMGKIFLVMPEWSEEYELPGGAIDVKDTVERGLVASAYRKTGRRISITASRPLYVGESSFFDDDTQEFCHSVYSTFDCADVIPVRASQPFRTIVKGEKSYKRAEWVDVAELRSTNLHPMHHPLLKYFGNEE